MMKMVVLLGPPGAGKGTVAEALADQGFLHVSTGNLLREQIQQGTPLGLEAKELMDHGRFVRDDVVVGMIRELISRAPYGAKILLDGFPRTLVQAEKLDELVDGIEGNLESVVLLECPDDIIVQRLSGRRTCSKCGSVYHMAFNPPSHDEQCDNDGCGLSQRPDDNPDTIRKRLQVYTDRTAPVINYYTVKNLIQGVNAAQSIEAVRHAVLEQLD